MKKKSKKNKNLKYKENLTDNKLFKINEKKKQKTKIT